MMGSPLLSPPSLLRRLACRRVPLRLSGTQHCHCRPYSSASSNNSNKIRFWPFAAIVVLGSAAYIALVKQRTEMASSSAPAVPQQQQQPPPPPTAAAQPAFSPADVTVIFVLGGPGAGKGTQCARLVDSHGFTHLSAGDLLRAEQDRPGSRFGDLIRSYIKDGLIVPMEVTIALLQTAMADALTSDKSTKGRFLIDGFPRKMDQALRFEADVCPARLVLFFDCPENVMQARLLERGKTSGRADDNADSIAKRFRTFIDTSMPVVDYYTASDKVLKIDATADADAVFANTEKSLARVLGSDF
ncbi:hypothetical protein CDD81_1710 [Ophiocordyceps australis]|uniref:Uridylate kinase n=1 Tax=Ophiocordyceps australis TaxID=1399860 RepID=A0A2C5XVB3_9HYPO|nr:hypothetical protein CDD81_1710 [Ophiocordyceps australis]